MSTLVFNKKSVLPSVFPHVVKVYSGLAFVADPVGSRRYIQGVFLIKRASHVTKSSLFGIAARVFFCFVFF